MTVIYVPRLIESAEQAETLPEGTIMFLPAGPYVWTARDPGGEFLDHCGRPWHFENIQDDESFTALVPIEAEEEWGEQAIAEGEFISVVRLVSPWEEVANRP